MVRFLVVPQWQGSSSSRAMQLVDGAHAVLGDLPRSGSRMIEVPLEAGDTLDSGVLRMSALNQTARNLRIALGELRERSQAAITFGGDAGVATVAALDAAAHGSPRHAPDDAMAVVWFSARGALHSPASSPSKAFHDMAARALVDPAVPRPHLSEPPPVIAGSRLTLVGVRALDDAQIAAAAEHGVALHAPDRLDPAALATAIVAAGASRVFIHVDLNVLDPAALSGLGHAEPFGLALAQLLDTIAALRERLPLAGAAITEYAPATPTAVSDDMATILRIVGALA